MNMDSNQIENSIGHLNDLVAKHLLSDLFKGLVQIIDTQKQSLYLKDQVRKQAEIYTNLLRYSFTDYQDPDRDKIYSKLLKSLYGIIDELKINLVAENRFLAINTLKQETNYEFLSEREKIENEVLKNKPCKESNTLFRQIWLSGYLAPEKMLLLDKLVESPDISWVNESLVVSALTISNLMYFDERKMLYLFKFYYRGIDKVWQRAMVGLVLNAYFYSERLKEFPEIMEYIDLIKKQKDFNINLEYVILQIIRTRETEKISRKLHDEIIPEVAKFKPKI
jgi:hypothetical protein